MWNIKYGKAWIKGIYNPAIWRLYGSRNHHMFCSKGFDVKANECFNEHFQESSVIFHKFKQFMLERKLVSGRDLDYDKEDFKEIFDYRLYDVSKDRFVSMFDKLRLK